MPAEIDMTGTEFAGAMKFRHAEVDVTYETGGVSFSPSALSMNRFQNVILTLAESDNPAVVSWDPEDEDILLFDPADGTELAAETEVSLIATGIGR